MSAPIVRNSLQMAAPAVRTALCRAFSSQQTQGLARRAFTAFASSQKSLPTSATSRQLHRRGFSSSSAASTKLAKCLEDELKYEKSNYEKPAESTCHMLIFQFFFFFRFVFFNSSKTHFHVKKACPGGWKMEQTPGDVNVCLVKEVGDKVLA